VAELQAASATGDAGRRPAGCRRRIPDPAQRLDHRRRRLGLRHRLSAASTMCCRRARM
jgi:hypothetical protein